MKFLIPMVAIVAACLFASDASAQGGSVGTRTRVVVDTYQVVRVPREKVYRTIQRRVWFPRRFAAPAGCVGTAVSTQVGGSAGKGAAAPSAPSNYSAPEKAPSAPAAPTTSVGFYAPTELDVLVEQHSQIQASQGRMFHSRIPFGIGGARYEGVGWSTRSPQAALENCCYYGEKPIVAQSVARGSNGWYATARYR
jgi:hypothetical protein